MKNTLGFLFVLTILYCLASLPAFLLYVFVGEYFFPIIGGPEHNTFLIFRIVFTVIACIIAFWGYKKDLSHWLSWPSSFFKHHGPVMK